MGALVGGFELLRFAAWALFGLALLVAAVLALVDLAGGITTHSGSTQVSYSDGERVVDPDPECEEGKSCARIWNPGSDVALDALVIGAGLAIVGILLSGLIWISSRVRPTDTPP